MSWVYLILAAIFEMIFGISVKYVDGFNHPRMLVWAALGGAGGLVFLTLAARKLPISVAYPVWTALAAIGIVFFGIVYLGESATFLKIASVIAVIAGVAGLKFASG